MENVKGFTPVMRVLYFCYTLWASVSISQAEVKKPGAFCNLNQLFGISLAKPDRNAFTIFDEAKTLIPARTSRSDSLGKIAQYEEFVYLKVSLPGHKGINAAIRFNVENCSEPRIVFMGDQAKLVFDFDKDILYIIEPLSASSTKDYQLNAYMWKSGAQFVSTIFNSDLDFSTISQISPATHRAVVTNTQTRAVNVVEFSIDNDVPHLDLKVIDNSHSTDPNRVMVPLCSVNRLSPSLCLNLEGDSKDSKKRGIQPFPTDLLNIDNLTVKKLTRNFMFSDDNFPAGVISSFGENVISFAERPKNGDKFKIHILEIKEDAQVNELWSLEENCPNLSAQGYPNNVSMFEMCADKSRPVDVGNGFSVQGGGLRIMGGQFYSSVKRILDQSGNTVFEQEHHFGPDWSHQAWLLGNQISMMYYWGSLNSSRGGIYTYDTTTGANSFRPVPDLEGAERVFLRSTGEPFWIQTHICNESPTSDGLCVKY